MCKGQNQAKVGITVGGFVRRLKVNEKFMT